MKTTSFFKALFYGSFRTEPSGLRFALLCLIVLAECLTTCCVIRFTIMTSHVLSGLGLRVGRFGRETAPFYEAIELVFE